MYLEIGDSQNRPIWSAVRDVVMAAVISVCMIAPSHAQELEHWQHFEILRDLNYDGLRGLPGGDAGLGVATALADNMLETMNDPLTQDPASFATDAILLQDATEGSLYLYTLGTNINDVGGLTDLYTGFNDIDEYYAHRLSQDVGFDENLFVIEFIATIYAFFYNRMPDIYQHILIRNGGKDVQSQTYFGLERDVALSQHRLQTELARFKTSSLMSDPLVRLGLGGVSAIQLIEDNEVLEKAGGGYRFAKRSPSQFDSESDTVYINTTDLHEYGYVVLLHELVQAGLKYAHTNGYLSAQDLGDLNSIAKKHFPSFSGYMNAAEISLGNTDDDRYKVSDLGPLSNYKAFAIGYTYKLLKQHFNALPPAEQVNATRYFGDVEGNHSISLIHAYMALDIGASDNYFQSFTLYGANAKSAEIDRYLASFTSNSGPISTLIKGVKQKAQAGVARDIYRDVFPAVNAALLF